VLVGIAGSKERRNGEENKEGVVKGNGKGEDDGSL
jgi:hypothetical protein